MDEPPLPLQQRPVSASELPGWEVGLAIPERTEQGARAMAALAKSRIDELGPRRFGAMWGSQSSTWLMVYLQAEDGSSAGQIIEARIADHYIDDPNDPFFVYRADGE